MLFDTRPHLFHFRLLALLVVFAGLASGCQSTRPGFSFQPAPGRVRAVAVPIATKDPVAVTAASVSELPAPRAEIQPRKRMRLRVQPATVAAVPAAIADPTSTMALTRRRPLLHRPHAAAEVGLGTTVLGVLGLVVLPIALIGLLLSGGGLVWGIVAGAAALAVLVAYLDPFGR